MFDDRSIPRAPLSSISLLGRSTILSMWLKLNEQAPGSEKAADDDNDYIITFFLMNIYILLQKGFIVKTQE